MSIAERVRSRLTLPRGNQLLVVVATAVAALPVVVAAIRAVARGWIPLGDHALIETRAYDVFTSHTPLVGTWSSASLTAGRDVNTPGPFMFDVLALPIRVFGGDAGPAFGVALVNVLAVIGIVVFAHRRGGVALAALAATTSAVMCWSMGSEVLFEPWNPHMVVLPFLFFLFLVWSMACGDVVALPWAIGVGSFVLQAHLSYAVLVPLLGLCGVVALGVRLRRERHGGVMNGGENVEKWTARRQHLRRVAAVAVLVLTASWIQPLVEQLTSDGEGNLSRLFHGMTSSGGTTTGFGSAARLVAGVVSVPPFWFRPSFGDTFVSSTGWRAPSGGLTAATLVALGVLLAACVWDARRRDDRTSTTAIATGVVGLLAGVVTTARAPVGVFGAATPHVLRWLWPLAAFITFAVVATVARRIVVEARHTRALVVGAASMTAIFAVLAFPTSNQSTGPNSQQWAIDSAKSLRRHVEELEGRGPLVVDGLFDEVFDPYGAVVLAEIQRQGIDYVAASHVLVRHLGDDRRFDGANARAAVYVRAGDAAEEGLAGTDRLAIVEGLSLREQQDLAELEERVAKHLDRDGVRLNADGRTALARGDLPVLRRQRADDAFDADELLASGEVVRLVFDDLVVLDADARETFHRYAELERTRRRETVALFIGPVVRTRE